MSDLALLLMGTATAAAVVNGALGYGFSSITAPIALLVLTNRVLNPALVLIELGLNAYVLVINRRAVPAVWRQVVPLIIGIVPGVAIGTVALTRVSEDWVKLATFAALVPVVLAQAAGYRRPIRRWRSGSLALGTGVGALYAVTTISGPPLAVALNNQGLSKDGFRAALGLVRLVESTLTAGVYTAAGLVAPESLSLLAYIAPGALVGIPLGAWLIRHVQVEMFRRVCMSVDACIVGFGLSRLLPALNVMSAAWARAVFAGVVIVDVWLLTRFFLTERRPPHADAGAPLPQVPS